jgi:uncharacterized protein (TIGR02588 family)
MKRNWLEWLILAVSVAAIAGVAGYLAIAALDGDPAPPTIVAEVDVGAGAEGPTGWTAPILIRNDGGQAARTLTIEARAEVDGTEETSTLTVDLLGPQSDTEGTVGFSGPPSGPIALRVVSFEVP